MQRIVGIPIAQLATPAGSISLLFVHVVTLLVCIGWAVGRGSDPICGEIGRGTMDLLVSLPVRRSTLLLVPAVAATFGSAVLALSILLGLAIAINTLTFSEAVFLGQFTPGAINLFSMIFCLTGITTLVSSIVRDRWRTIAVSVGFYLVSLIIETVSRLWPEGKWLHYCTFLSVYQPQELIIFQGTSLWMQVKYDAVLIGLGLLCYALGVAIFSRRDIPASR
jgi:ABC-2 type transport system permease protein